MNNNYKLVVDVSEQSMQVLQGEELLKTYQVSTALNGVGEQMGSECTPRGKHIITEKIGADCEANTVFVGREPTGEIYKVGMRDEFPDRDWILTRIMWLGGCEPGCNQGGEVDSHDRYIYIHGTPDDVDMTIPGSRGCVRMQNNDIIELFDLVDINTEVIINE